MEIVMTEQLLQQLKKYEGEWVALVESDGETIIGGSGSDAAEASENATENGYTETTLMKVLPSDVAYVPFA